ncbi:glutathione synthetase-like [Saccoglossus kowalevskii]|uniref:Glutathione synthetase n=1 Tax=Saccoglossus kowalevskii TaxID=10224 RepID=A0ABM0LTV4_SACKO|nr:PREDICTED: glutathione synthetase-like [Saccoglossus kowalevskii]
METSVSLPLEQDLLDDVVAKDKDYAFLHGIIMRTRQDPNSSEVICYAPHVLLPSPVPKRLFQQAVDVQKDFNLLLHGVTHDSDFITSSLKSAIQVDEFTRKLYEIYEEVYVNGTPAQPIQLALLRADYMFDAARGKETPADEMKLRQIEINTIASSFAGLGSQVSDLHRYNLRNLCESKKAASLSENRALSGLAQGLVEAWKLYKCDRAAILFLIEDVSQNIFDQRWLEYEIHKINPTIHTMRRKFSDVINRAKTEGDKLVIDGYEIAIVYFRYGYMPNQYVSEKEWEARLMVEKSRAIKCPSISYHLAGTKKVQQELSRVGAVERFQKYFSDGEAAVKRIRETFAGLYTLDMGSEGDATVKMALTDPDKYVLKPQREGGGNNIFGKDITSTLKDIGEDERRAEYILMDRIQPAIVSNYQIRCWTTTELIDMVSELGIFGAIICLLRTKNTGFDDGGVAAGAAVLDSPYLV